MSAGSVITVEEVVSGSELSADVLTTATSITVEDATDFQPEGGELLIGGVEKGYAAVNEDTGVITLDAAIGTAATAGDPVLVLPGWTERFAHTRLEDDEEVLVARVPHALYDRLPVGARDGALDELELVELGRDPDGELVVLDVLNREPAVDGSFIDPTTIPPAPITDGNPPSSSPTPTIIGLIQSLFVTWVGIANNDLVTYEVHVSTSSGFTPGVGTYAGETAGTRFTVGALPGTTNRPQPGTTYFVKLIAKDDDGAAAAGAEASGTPAQINTPDIVTASIVAGLLAANSVEAGNLAAEIILASSLVAGSPSGARVQLGIDVATSDVGLSAYGGDGVSPTFRVDAISGEVYARGSFDFGVVGGSRLSATDFIDLAQQTTATFETVTPAGTPSAGQTVQAGGMSTASRTFAPTLSGALLFMVVTTYRFTGLPTGCSTPAGWTLLDNSTSGNLRQQVFARENAPTLTTQAVTFTGTLPSHVVMSVQQFAGVALSGAFDQESPGVATATATVGSGNTPTTTQADELSVGVSSSFDDDGFDTNLSAWTSGFGKRTDLCTFPFDSINTVSQATAWRRETATGVKSFDATWDRTRDNLIAYVATFKAKAAGIESPPADVVRHYSRNVAGVARAHQRLENGQEGAVVLGTAGEAWRLEYKTASVNIPSTAAHAGGAATVAISGLVVGDLCFLLGKGGIGNSFHFVTDPVVGTTDQITLRYYNADAAVQDPAAETFHFLVIHRS